MAIFSKSRLEQVEARERPDPARQTIMIVDDEDANLRVLSTLLEPLYRLVTARDGRQALDMIEAMPDRDALACIISDQRMPRMTGVELFQRVRVLLPRTMCIIVSGFIDLDAIVDSINRADIYQFIIKPFDANDFVLTVKRAVESFELKRQLDAYHQQLEEKIRERTQELAEKNRELERAYKALQEVSVTDPLTGLHNRRFLLQHLDADIALSTRHYEDWLRDGGAEAQPGNDLVFFIVDIDHFKEVNDRYGHAAGDRVLTQMRQRLLDVSRESDYLVRWGGEEFLVVARATCRSEADSVAARICEAVGGRPFDLDDGLQITRTCSVGYACYPFLPRQPRLLSWPQVVELADQGLYRVKRGGRNGWCGVLSAGNALTEAAAQRLMQAPQAAIDSGELRVARGSRMPDTMQQSA